MRKYIRITAIIASAITIIVPNTNVFLVGIISLIIAAKLSCLSLSGSTASFSFSFVSLSSIAFEPSPSSAAGDVFVGDDTGTDAVGADAAGESADGEPDPYETGSDRSTSVKSFLFTPKSSTAKVATCLFSINTVTLSPERTPSRDEVSRSSV